MSYYIEDTCFCQKYLSIHYKQLMNKSVLTRSIANKAAAKFSKVHGIVINTRKCIFGITGPA